MSKMTVNPYTYRQSELVSDSRKELVQKPYPFVTRPRIKLGVAISIKKTYKIYKSFFFKVD